MKIQIGTILLNSLKQLFTTAQHVAVIVHQNPDGDAIGSAIALSRLFRENGAKPMIITPNDYPTFLQWLKDDEPVLVFDKQAPQEVESQIEKTELIVAVDFNVFKRSGGLQEILTNAPATKVLIDHHPDPSTEFDYVISDTSVSSASELLYELLLLLGFKSRINRFIAQNLFMGIMSDTGTFYHNASLPRTFEIAAELLAYGFDREQLTARLYSNYSASRLQLLGYSIHEKLTVLPEYHTAYFVLSIDDLERYHYEAGDVEGFVNIPFSVAGIYFSVLIMERENHIKLSLRSRGTFDVNFIARKYFNGGGHRNAAGGRFYGATLSETVEKFLSILPKYKNALTQSAGE